MKPWFLLFTSCNRLLAHFKEIHKRRICFQQVFWLKETTVRALLYILCIIAHMFICPEPYKAAQRHIAIKNNKKCVVNPYMFSEQVKTFLHARCPRLMLLIKLRLLSPASSKRDNLRSCWAAQVGGRFSPSKRLLVRILENSDRYFCQLLQSPFKPPEAIP